MTFKADHRNKRRVHVLDSSNMVNEGRAMGQREGANVQPDLKPSLEGGLRWSTGA